MIPDQVWEWVQPGRREATYHCYSIAEAIEEAQRYAVAGGGPVWVYRCTRDGVWIESECYLWNCNGELKRRDTEQP